MVSEEVIKFSHLLGIQNTFLISTVMQEFKCEIGCRNQIGLVQNGYDLPEKWPVSNSFSLEQSSLPKGSKTLQTWK